jgi:hypothetical protein
MTLSAWVYRTLHQPGRTLRSIADVRVPARHSDPSTRGILTTAYGARRYRDLAVTLARSLDSHCPDTPRAVVTDVVDRGLARLYDHQVPLRPERGSGLVQKLWLPEYSPFDKTLFIDADTLVVRDLGFLWDLLDGHAVAAVGARYESEGFWFGDIAARCERFQLSSIPIFNGGLYYFEQGPAARRIFGDARSLVEQYEEHGFTTMGNGSVNDEVVLSVAIARNADGEMVDDDARAMRTPLGITGPLRIDVPRGVGQFVKGGRPIEPALIHFCGDWASGFHYRRERVKLALTASGLAAGIVGPTVNVLCGPPHFLGRMVRRMGKLTKKALRYRRLATKRISSESTSRR